jgi:hypothetical protein
MQYLKVKSFFSFFEVCSEVQFPALACPSVQFPTLQSVQLCTLNNASPTMLSSISTFPPFEDPGFLKEKKKKHKRWNMEVPGKRIGSRHCHKLSKGPHSKSKLAAFIPVTCTSTSINSAPSHSQNTT